MATGITDYTVYPLVPKGGIVQLMYRQGESAFHVALASNTASAEWEAEVLCRPFLRLPFDRAPSAISRPGSLTLTDGKLTMTVRRSVVLHAVHVTVISPEAVKLYCGPAGKLQGYGYTECQISNTNSFHGFPDEYIEGGCWLSHRNEWTGVLHTGPGKIVKWGIGVTVELPSGESVLSFAAGKSKEEAIASAQKVAAMSAEDAEAFLTKRWEEILAKTPESIHRLPLSVRNKALEAIYLHLEDTRFEPQGCIHYATPVAVMTGYRMPSANWDTSLSALAMAHIDPDYAIGILLNFVENANPDGSLPVGIETSGSGGISGIDSHRDIVAWATWHLYKITGRDDVLDALLPGLVRHGKALQRFINSFSDYLVRTNLIDDNSPGDDPARHLTQPGLIDKTKTEGAKLFAAGPEVSGFMANTMVCLSRLCTAAGRDKEAASFSQSAKMVAAGARKHLWKPKIKDTGYLYGDDFRFYDNPHRFHGAPAMPESEVRETMQSALRQGGPLWPNYGIATIGTDEPAFDPNQLWRGPVWIGTNYLLAETCAVMGLTDLAEDISVMTQELVSRNAGFWECHNPLTGQGHRTQMMMGLNASAFLCFCLGTHQKQAWVKPEELI